MIISFVIIDVHRSKNWHRKSTNAPINQYLKISCNNQNANKITYKNTGLARIWPAWHWRVDTTHGGLDYDQCCTGLVLPTYTILE